MNGLEQLTIFCHSIFLDPCLELRQIKNGSAWLRCKVTARSLMDAGAR